MKETIRDTEAWELPYWAEYFKRHPPHSKEILLAQLTQIVIAAFSKDVPKIEEIIPYAFPPKRKDENAPPPDHTSYENFLREIADEG